MTEPWSKNDFVDLWRKLFPETYTSAIESSVGFDWVQAAAAVFSRVDEAVNSTTARLFIKPHSLQTAPPASGGAQSRGDVIIRRANPVDAFLVPAGTVIRPASLDSFGDDRTGSAFMLLTSVSFADGESEKTGTVISVSQGEFANVSATPAEFDLVGRRDFSGSVVAADGLTVDVTSSPDSISAGDVGRLVLIGDGSSIGEFRQVVGASSSSMTLSASVPLGTTIFEMFEFEDVGLSVHSMTAGGGLDPWLEMHGNERLTRRQAGESDDSYAARICATDDNITKNAILRAANRALSSTETPFEYKDYNTQMGFVLDRSAMDTDLFDWRILATSRMVRYFVICVGLQNDGDIGAPLDSADAVPSSHFANALDWAFMDGQAFGWKTALRALHAELSRAAAGGIAFDIVLDPSL